MSSKSPEFAVGVFPSYRVACAVAAGRTSTVNGMLSVDALEGSSCAIRMVIVVFLVPVSSVLAVNVTVTSARIFVSLTT